MNQKYSEDDYCDLYPKKICDNCGKCMENEGVDLKSIQIEDIAKTVDENKVLEEEYYSSIESPNSDDDIDNDEIEKQKAILEAEYKKLIDSGALTDEEYVDASDFAISFDEAGIDPNNLDDSTTELTPGLRRIKKKDK